jgi:hypothetical protein
MNSKADKVYIKKRWDEESIEFYLEFENDYATKQIEIRRDTTVRLSIECPIAGDLFLYDQTLSDLELEPQDYITAEEFYNVWNKGIIGITRNHSNQF